LFKNAVERKKKKMPKRDELSGILYGRPPGSSFSISVDGTPALLRSDVVTQDLLKTGDRIKMFALPDGKTFIAKVDINLEDSYTVGRVTPAHIYFDDEMTVKEK
jgi:hypothetical protein